MPWLSINITPGEYQKRKAIVALKDQKSIKDFVLNCILGTTPSVDDMSGTQAFGALSDFLKRRIKQARRGELPTKLSKKFVKPRRL